MGTNTRLLLCKSIQSPKIFFDTSFQSINRCFCLEWGLMWFLHQEFQSCPTDDSAKGRKKNKIKQYWSFRSRYCQGQRLSREIWGIIRSWKWPFRPCLGCQLFTNGAVKLSQMQTAAHTPSVEHRRHGSSITELLLCSAVQQTCAHHRW